MRIVLISLVLVCLILAGCSPKTSTSEDEPGTTPTVPVAAGEGSPPPSANETDASSSVPVEDITGSPEEPALTSSDPEPIPEAVAPQAQKPPVVEPPGTRTWRDPYGKEIRAAFVSADSISITLNLPGKGIIHVDRRKFSKEDLAWVDAKMPASRPNTPVIANDKPGVEKVGARRSSVYVDPSDGSVLYVRDYVRKHYSKYKPGAWGKLLANADGTFSIDHTFSAVLPGIGRTTLTKTYTLDANGKILRER